MSTNGQVSTTVLEGMLVLDGDGVASAMGELEPMCGRKGIAIRTVTTELCRVSLREQSTRALLGNVRWIVSCGLCCTASVKACSGL